MIVNNVTMVSGSVPDDALFLTETDTIAWEQSTLPSSVNWWGVAYGSGKFVAVSYTSSNAVVYSEDGVTWNTATLPSSVGLSSVTYGNGKFVAVGYGSNIAMYSEDGINWNASELPNSETWRCVTYGNGKFVAIAYSDATVNTYGSAYSEDGINWIGSELSQGAYSLTYGNGKFVASRNTIYSILYSEDGINWNDVSINGIKCRALTYGNNIFVALSYGGNIAYYSEDGINWIETELPSTANWQSVTYGENKFVAVAYNSNIAAYSVDGIHWYSLILPNTAYWYSIAYGSDKFVTIANNSNIALYSTPSTKTIIANVNDIDVTEDIIETLGFGSWAGSFAVSGQTSTTLYTASGCSLAVDQYAGMAFVTIQGGTSTSYENIYFQTPTLPDGVTFLTTQTYGGPTGGTAQRYFTAAFTGVTGKINVSVVLGTPNANYDYVPATITMTYA